MMNPVQLMQMANQLRNNPGAVLNQLGIPQNMATDPQAIVQQLMNKGTVSQAQYNNAMQIAKNMGFKF